MHRPAPARHKRPAGSCPAAMPRPDPAPASIAPARSCPRINAPAQVLSPFRRVRIPPPATPLPSQLSRPACLALPCPPPGTRPGRFRPGRSPRPQEGRCDLPGRLRRRSGRNLPAIIADHGENRNNYDLSRCRAPARARGAPPPLPGFPAFSRPRRYLRRNDLATNFPGSGLLSPGKTDKPRIF